MLNKNILNSLIPYTYELVRKYPHFDLRVVTKQIRLVLKKFYGIKVFVYKNGFTFYTPNYYAFTDGKKRSMGKELAKIPALRKLIITYNYTHNDGQSGKTSQLFKRVN